MIMKALGHYLEPPKQKWIRKDRSRFIIVQGFIENDSSDRGIGVQHGRYLVAQSVITALENGYLEESVLAKKIFPSNLIDPATVGLGCEWHLSYIHVHT